MKTRYRYKADVPYSLHDMRIEKMKVMDHSLKLFFEHGFIQSKKPYKQVDGTILLEKVNLDFCFVYLLNNNGKLGEFYGQKMTLTEFLKRYEDFSFEVIGESYGYNFAVYNGYFMLPKQNDFNELSIMICYEGDMIYETDE